MPIEILRLISKCTTDAHDDPFVWLILYESDRIWWGIWGFHASEWVPGRLSAQFLSNNVIDTHPVLIRHAR